MKRSTLAIAAIALAAAAAPVAAQNEQFIPANFYWVGPYAPGGSGFGGSSKGALGIVVASDSGSMARMGALGGPRRLEYV